MATTNIDFKNVTAINYSNTSLTELWWCDTSNATCTKLWPQCRGYICVRNATRYDDYTQTSFSDGAIYFCLLCLPKCLNMTLCQYQINDIELCSNASCIVPNGAVCVEIANCTSSAVTYPISYTGRLMVKPLGENPKTVFIESCQDDDVCGTMTQTVNYTNVCANAFITVPANTTCKVNMPSTWTWCYNNQFTFDDYNLWLECACRYFQYMTGCGILCQAVVRVGTYNLSVPSYNSVCCIDLV